MEPNTGFGAGSGDAASRGEPSRRKRRSRASASAVFQYFETAPDKKSRICKRCRSSYFITTGTGNLRAHLEKCYPEYDNSQWGNAVQETCEAQAMRNETILEAFITLGEDVRKSIKKIKWNKSFSVEFWTPNEQNKYMPVRCHWIDESWTLYNALYDVCPLPRSYSYKDIDSALADSLIIEAGCGSPVFVTYASKEDSEEGCHKNSEESCHEVSEEDRHQNSEEDCQEDIEEEYWHTHSEEDDKLDHIHVPCAVHLIKSLINDCLKEMKPILSKIENFFLKLRSNPELMTTFKQSSVHSHKDGWKLPSDTSTSWYNEYIMLDLVRKAPHAMDTTTTKHINFFRSEEVSLNSEEKDKVNIVLKFLDIFYNTATELGRCELPTLGLVLSFMDPILDMIHVSKVANLEWIQNMAKNMAILADRYVECFKKHIFAEIILDPRIKIKLIPKFLHSKYTHQEIMRHINCIGHNELLQYLIEPTESMSTNILEWWKENSSRYPRLSHAARESLTIQGMSVRLEKELTIQDR